MASHVCCLQFVFNMEQGLPVLPEWLFFNRVNARARKGIEIGPARLLLRYAFYFLYLFYFIFIREKNNLSSYPHGAITENQLNCSLIWDGFLLFV